MQRRPKAIPGLGVVSAALRRGTRRRRPTKHQPKVGRKQIRHQIVSRAWLASIWVASLAPRAMGALSAGGAKRSCKRRDRHLASQTIDPPHSRRAPYIGTRQDSLAD